MNITPTIRYSLALLSLLVCIPDISSAKFLGPLEKIAKSSCRFSAWSELGDDCKMDLPGLDPAQYVKYKEDMSYRRVYSVLWWATYNYGWDVGFGGHEWVDIATSAGTPVRAIADGVVVKSAWSNGWGNVVVIKHTLSSGKIVYSNYAHLSKLIAKNGAIKSGSILGEVGNTGNSYGNHLHFQIDTTEGIHPYYFTKCGNVSDPIAIVNSTRCQGELTTHTVDPLAFIASNDGVIETKPTEKINPQNLISREKILLDEIEEFLRLNKVSVTSFLPGGNLSLGATTFVRLSAVDYRGRPLTGTLPADGLEAIFDHKALSILPEKTLLVEKWLRDISIRALKTGRQTVEFKIGKKSIARFTFTVYRPGDLSYPQSALLQFTPNPLLGEEKLAGVIFRTPYSTPQIDIPYEGTYILRVKWGKASICNISKNPKQNCAVGTTTKEFSFTFNDTFRWILLFHIIPTDTTPITLDVIGKKSGKVYASGPYLSIGLPNWLPTNYIYYDSVIAGLKKNLFPLQSGYVTQDRELGGYQAKDMLSRLIAHLRWSGINIGEHTRSLINQINDSDRVSRIDFATIILSLTNANLDTSADNVWNDESGPKKSIMTTLRKQFHFAWKDGFGALYFQPNRSITIGESLYLIDQVLSARN